MLHTRLFLNVTATSVLKMTFSQQKKEILKKRNIFSLDLLLLIEWKSLSWELQKELGPA